MYIFFYAYEINLSVAMLDLPCVQVLSPSSSSPNRDTQHASESVLSGLVVEASEPVASEQVASEQVATVSESVSSASETLATSSEPLATASEQLATASESVSSEPVPVAKTLVAKYPRTPPGMGKLAKKESSWAHYAVLSKILDDKRRAWNENSIAKKPRHGQ